MANEERETSNETDEIRPADEDSITGTVVEDEDEFDEDEEDLEDENADDVEAE